MRNVEIKAKIHDVEKLISLARTLTNGKSEEIKQRDTFFKVLQGRLKLREFQDNSGELIYYERPDVEGPKMCSYEKCRIDSTSVGGLKDVLTKALGTSGIVKKVRHLFLVDQTRIHVDSVEGLGDFMELEVVLRPEQSPEDGEKIAFNLMEKLGIQKENLLSGAYTDLLNK